MSLRDTLKKVLEIDYNKAPKKIWNLNNLEMKWSTKEKLYIGIDENGEEWISSLQHTTIPIFSFTCPNLARKNNAEVVCKSINFIPITHKGAIKCRKCNKTFTPEFVIPKTTAAFEIFKNLDK